jgi:hypothetical protein
MKYSSGVDIYVEGRWSGRKAITVNAFSPMVFASDVCIGDRYYAESWIGTTDSKNHEFGSGVVLMFDRICFLYVITRKIDGSIPWSLPDFGSIIITAECDLDFSTSDWLKFLNDLTQQFSNNSIQLIEIGPKSTLIVEWTRTLDYEGGVLLRERKSRM